MLYDYMTEAEAITDYGDMYVDDCDDNKYTADRAHRKSELIGKYIIVCDSIHDHSKSRYLQDQTISPEFIGHFWTNYVDNAKAFIDITSAYIKCGNLKYNNPRVMYMCSDFKLMEVDKFGHIRKGNIGGKVYCSEQCYNKANSEEVRRK